MSDQVYTTFAHVWEDLEFLGFEHPANALRKIRAASEWIEGEIGTFIPITATRSFDGNGKRHLFLDPPLLSVTSITHDGDTLAASDYLLYPRDRHWEDGPYTRISIDPDASGISVWKRELDVVSIVGEWGRYDKSEATGATVQDNPLSDSATTLEVDDASLVTPGESLLIEDEQILVTGYSGSGTDTAKNLAADVGANDGSLTLETGHGLNAGEILRINSEQFYVSGLVGATTVLVKRAWNATKRATHSSGGDVFVYRTFSIDRAINGTTAASHTQNTAISRYVAPGPIAYLATQIASLMIRKASTGYAGKTVDLEAATAFYVNELPQSTIDQIARQYRC